MSRYSSAPYSVPPNAPGRTSSPGFKQEDRASQSGSEDGNYGLYQDAQKLDVELDDEGGNALTSQTLNADGTPKRPMNAFMIFARRRRPQVSAENQSMRTGEISKILSKEWVSMPAHDKQFYLEQAKQLKETFNNKYPDYVYRRRPNNSRKRRRSDGAALSTDPNARLSEGGDDLGGGIDLDVAPLHGDEQMAGHLNSSYGRQHDRSHGFGGPSRSDMGHPRTPYSTSDSGAFRTSGHLDARAMPYPPSPADRVSLSHLDNSLPYPYVSSQSAQSPTYPGDTPESAPSWSSRVPHSWMGPGGPERLTLSTQKYPSSASRQWSGSTDSPVSAATPPPGSAQNYFPTLNAPFYPQSQVPGYHQSTTTSSAASTSNSSVSPLSATSSHSHYDTLNHHAPASSLGREYTPRGYGSSSMNSGYAGHPRDTLPFSQRSLPPAQSAAYHNAPSSSSPTSSAHGYWSRD